MTVSVWQDKSDQEQITSDVLVIGAGIVGSYVASLLADAGMSVVVADAREIAGGATGRNAGMLLTGLAEHYSRAVESYGVERAREAWQLTVENRERSRELAEGRGVRFQRCGSLLLAVSEAEARELDRSAEMLQEHGFRAQYEPQDPLNRGFVAALAQPDDAVIDPVRLTEAILVESGAQVYEHSEVFSIESEAEGLLVRSRRATFHPQFCVLAINGYAPLLEPYFADRV
ncbi:MAG: NAD(P)/FAD-dependent oxidoreductase, partial [Anaerolineae bacterium]